MRALRVLGRTVAISTKTISVSVVFAASLGGGAVLHLDARPIRALATAITNSVLADTLVGEVTIERLGHLGLDGLRGVTVRVKDDTHTEVLLVRDVDVLLDPKPLLVSLQAGGAIHVKVPTARIGAIDANLDVDEKGTLRIERAFTPKPSPPSPKKAGPGTVVKVDVGAFVLAHAWAHGNVVPGLDADIDELAVKGTLATDGVLDLTVDGIRVTARGPRGKGGAPPVTASAHGGLVLPIGDGVTTEKADLELRASAGSAALTLAAHLDGEALKAELDVPAVGPEVVKSLVPGFEPTEPLALRATVTGTLRELDANVLAHAGTGNVDLKAKLRRTAGGRALTAQANVADVDLHAFAADIPPSKLALVLSIDAARSDAGVLEGSYRIVGQPGTAFGQVIPAFTAAGRADGKKLEGNLVADERGARIKARYEVAPLDANAKITFDAEADVPELARIARVKVPATGRAYVTAKGSVDLGKQSIDTAVAARLDAIEASGSKVEHLEASATVAGPLTKPVTVAHVRAHGVSTGEQRLDRVVADVRVTPIAGGVRIDDVLVHADRGKEQARIEVASVDVSTGGVRVHDARISGLGEDVTLGVDQKGNELHVVAKSSGVSLGRVASFLGTKKDDLPEGFAILDVDLRASPRGNEGHAVVELRGVKLGQTSAGSTLRATFHENEVVASGQTEIKGIGKLALAPSRVTLPGSAADPKAWARALFDVALEGEVDLANAFATLPEEARSGARVRGTLGFRVHASRQDDRIRPAARVVLGTRGLEVDAGDDRIRDTDVEVVLDGDGESGELGVGFSAWDPFGGLVRGSARAIVPVTEVLADPSRIAQVARTLPLALHAEVPTRDVGRLPLGLFGTYSGTAAAVLDASGSIERPTVVLTLGLDDITTRARAATSSNVEATLVEAPEIAALAEARGTRRGKRGESHSFDLGATLKYDGSTATVVTSILQKGVERARLEAEAKARIVDLLDHGSNAKWTADAKLRAGALDLALVPFLPRGVRGILDANAEVRDLHHKPSIDLHARVANATYERVSFPEVTVDASLSGEKGLVAEGKVKQESGGASVRVAAQFDFADGLIPIPRIERGLNLSYDVDRFRLAVLKPVVRTALPEIDGILVGKGRLFVDEKKRELEGSLALHQGFFYVPKLGEEVQDVEMALRVQPGGRITLEKLDGRIGAGRFSVSAAAMVEPGARLRATANVVVNKEYPLPISVDGVFLGEVDTKTQIKVDASPKAVEVDVDVPELRFELPNQSTQSLQELDPDPTVEVGRRDSHGKLVEVALRKAPPLEPEKKDPLPVKVRIRLGDNVYITRETELRVGMTGMMAIFVKDPLAIDGKINLREGFLEVQDKRFTIERGTVSWDDKSAVDNPTIIATAGYVSEGAEYHVYADYAGNVKTGKLKLRSEPTLKENQILSLLLFGEPYGQVGGRTGSGANKGNNNQAGDLATSYGAGVATHGLNRAIRDLASIDVVTKVTKDERTQAARPEVGVRVKNNLVLGVEVVTGTVPPSEERSFFKVDWRFLRHLSLVAKKGTRYSTIFDLLWQYRY